jgi:ABC-type Fe3+-hydroxamate transport system substrate-binding protein
MRLTIALVAAVLVAGCGEETRTREAGGPSFPVTIEHKFGTTEIPAAPKRVVAVGFNDQDFALAVGVEFARARLFTALGMTASAAIDKAAGKSFYAQVGPEDLDLLDQDVLVIYGTPKDVAAIPTLARLDVVRDGRVVYLDAAGDFANALGFSSPLSLPYAIDHGVPQLADALR